jgi:hypothetical protein
VPSHLLGSLHYAVHLRHNQSIRKACCHTMKFNVWIQMRRLRRQALTDDQCQLQGLTFTCTGTCTFLRRSHQPQTLYKKCSLNTKAESTKTKIGIGEITRLPHLLLEADVHDWSKWTLRCPFQKMGSQPLGGAGTSLFQRREQGVSAPVKRQRVSAAVFWGFGWLWVLLSLKRRV